MNIKQIIVNDDTVLIFTENPEQDIVKLVEAYTNDDAISDFGFQLGYEKPELYEFNFLGNNYPCISLWFDNEDIPEFFKNYKVK